MEMHKGLNLQDFVVWLHRCKGKTKLLLGLHENGNTILMCLESCSVEPAKLAETAAKLLPEGMYEIFAA